MIEMTTNALSCSWPRRRVVVHLLDPPRSPKAQPFIDHARGRVHDESAWDRVRRRRHDRHLPDAIVQ